MLFRSGEVTIFVDHPDFARTFDDEIEIPPGISAPSRTIRLQRGGAIDGIVVDDAGQPIVGAVIEACCGVRRASRFVQHDASTDGAGRFAFAHLPAGRYTVTAHGEGRPGQVIEHRSIEVDVAEGTTVAAKVELAKRR